MGTIMSKQTHILVSVFLMSGILGFDTNCCAMEQRFSQSAYGMKNFSHPLYSTSLLDTNKPEMYLFNQLLNLSSKKQRKKNLLRKLQNKMMKFDELENKTTEVEEEFRFAFDDEENKSINGMVTTLKFFPINPAPQCPIKNKKAS
jgi:hypothetical protein